MGRPAAGPHVKTVDDVTGFQARLRHGLHVAGLTRTFQAVNQHDFPARLAHRPLGEHEHLHVRLRAIESRLDGIAHGVQPAFPEVTQDGEYVRVRNQRTKRLQDPILPASAARSKIGECGNVCSCCWRPAWSKHSPSRVWSIFTCIAIPTTARARLTPSILPNLRAIAVCEHWS